MLLSSTRLDTVVKNKDRWRGIRSTVYGCMVSSLILLATSACSSMVASATQQFADNLSGAMADHDDAATVKAGAPAYLLMMDALVRGNPKNPRLLAKAARLYSAYAGAFIQDPVRSRRLTARALDYAQLAACQSDSQDCALRQMPFGQFEQRVENLSIQNVPIHYTLAAAWAGWIQARRDDFDALAGLVRVEALMRRILDLDESHMQGGVHIYLGTLAILLPPALGGKPEAARNHYDRAIELSNGHNLMAKVMYARHYARTLFDRPLHDRLLREVLAADPHQSGYVLVNTMAQQQAKQLLDSASDFF